MPPWNAAKAKVQLRLSVQRLRILQQKKEAQAKASRRDIATLLERGKIETARVKVENIINEDIHVELLELLELYCELLLARFGLLDQNTREPDPGVNEGVCSIIHAAPRTELKELHVLRDILMHKFGREFSVAVMENRDGCVTDRVVRKLGVETPSTELVDAYLTEIAKAYSVQWTPPIENVDGDNGSNDHGPDGGVKESATKTEKQPVLIALPDLQTGSTGSAPRLPELPPTEDEAQGKESSNHGKPKTAGAVIIKGSKTSPPPTETSEDDFDTLTRRFAALKKR